MSDESESQKEIAAFPLKKEALSAMLKSAETELTFDSISNIDCIKDVTPAQCGGFSALKFDQCTVTDLTQLSKFKLDTLAFIDCNLTTTQFFKGLNDVNTVQLDLSLNRMQDITSLMKSKYIREIKLSINNIKLPGAILGLFQLVQLTKLDFSSNRIESIPSQIGVLQNLIELNLSKNKLTSIQPVMYLQKLQKVDVSGNQIKDLKNINYLSPLPNLFILNFKLIDGMGEQNPILSNPEYLPRIKKHLTVREWLDGQKVQIFGTETLKESDFDQELEIFKDSFEDIAKRNGIKTEPIKNESSPVLKKTPQILTKTENKTPVQNKTKPKQEEFDDSLTDDEPVQKVVKKVEKVVRRESQCSVASPTNQSNDVMGEIRSLRAEMAAIAKNQEKIMKQNAAIMKKLGIE
ncbi:U2_small nuclear ribonucleoprotein A' [Hexamita inflata]|uniref:Putative n=1 Tax=Hexamita inflata TaxID=28002 RepID=A0AA86NKF6_9EUKA|nr:U2 small nuclear ribonucleoprotein A' [Hexamita inflata]